MTVGPVFPAARLQVRVRDVGWHLQFAVTDAGEFWLWDLETGAATAGTFRGSMSEDEADAALAAAGNALAASPESAGGEAGWHVRAGGVERLIPAGAAVTSGFDGAVAPLIERARRSPVATVRLEVRVVDVPGIGAMTGFVWVSTGTEPVEFRIDPDRLSVIDAEGLVHPLAAPTMGLVEPDGTLRDGIRAPALLPPGHRAGCSFPVTPGASRAGAMTGGQTSRGVPDTASTPGTPGASAVAGGEMTGHLTLAGPWPTPPLEPFALRAALS